MMELYHRNACPYSKRVRDYIDQKGLRSHIESYEIGEDDQARQHLNEMNGGEQVPCLVVDGKPMLESLMIISWLEENVAPQVEAQNSRYQSP